MIFDVFEREMGVLTAEMRVGIVPKFTSMH